MKALQYRVIPQQAAPRLKCAMVDIAIHGMTGRMSSTLLRQAKNRLDKHRRQAERGMRHLLTVCSLDRYREAS